MRTTPRIKHQLQQLKAYLLARAEQPRQNFRLTLIGFLIFMLGGLIVGGGGLLLSPSIWQELLAAAGLIIMGAGIILATLGYLSLSLLRLFRFFTNESSND